MATAPVKKPAAKTKVAVVPAKKIVAAASKVVAAKPVAKAAVPAVKSAVKPAIKVAVKPAVKLKAVTAKLDSKPAEKKNGAAGKPVIAKPVDIASAKDKAKKTKLVRDSFTMPEPEYAALGKVKKACITAGVEVKKSQLLRIGLALLDKTDVATLKTLIAGLAPLKAGRPKKEK